MHMAVRKRRGSLSMRRDPAVYDSSVANASNSISNRSFADTWRRPNGVTIVEYFVNLLAYRVKANEVCELEV